MTHGGDGGGGGGGLVQARAQALALEMAWGLEREARVLGWVMAAAPGLAMGLVQVWVQPQVPVPRRNHSPLQTAKRT